MLVVGIAFSLFAALLESFKLSIVASAVVTGVVFVALGLLLGERFPRR